MASLFVGLMSGTSLDGADAALVDLSPSIPRTLAFATVPFPAALREQIMSLSEPGKDSLELAGRVSIELADLYARAVEAVLVGGGVTRGAITAIGCHGQTVRHRPDLGFTIQLNDPARLAERTGIDVVADFRRRDMAAGGQGAPLVPAFHEAVFRDTQRSRAVVNIGGISNITWLPPGRKTLGFDCGPGNVLLDGWARRHLGRDFDEDGQWASRGRTDATLLDRLLEEPFLDAPPPKSTGRELFRLAWLEEKLPSAYQPEDVQSTLTDFTARSIVDSINRFCPETQEIYLSGGGARNGALFTRIADLACRLVEKTDTLGVPTGHVESMAFAWLAMKCMRREPVDLTAATGARAPRVLGAIYAA
ncbi:MAG TPA: anhydro-N-acetylmuramic acid kinase [Usitatibacter sp.]|nr:anhydro-N-acetylmuramic acid kinase [Usitatibacter sp.]